MEISTLLLKATITSRYIIFVGMVIAYILYYKISKRPDLSYNMTSICGIQGWLIHGIIFYGALLYSTWDVDVIPLRYGIIFNLWSSILRLHMLIVIIGVSILKYYLVGHTHGKS